MKTLSIAPVVPAFKLKWRITTIPFISVRKVLTRTIAIPSITKQNRRKVSPPSSSPLNYFLLALTFLYLAILVAGGWVMVQIFWQWTTDSSSKWFPIS
ncbi:MAG TPA: hypothetical protein VIU12_25440 [Chryseolinea sp.]